MTDSLQVGKRALTIAVAAATILWSVGFSAFVAPLTARAAGPGDLIKGTTLSTVYYYGNDGQRYAFPNEKTYFSWYTDFSGVMTMSDSQLAAIPLAGNIAERYGVRWIKIQSDAKAYAVTPQGKVRWIESEAAAAGLAGSTWNTRIDDVPDVFFVDYSVGPSITSAMSAYNGALVSSGGSTWLVWNGQKRMVTAAGMSGNHFQARALLSGSGIDLSSMPQGADVTGRESALVDAAQTGGGSVPVTGGLSVSLASDTPASATVPAGAASVSFTKFKLTANTGSATVSSIAVTLGGVGVVSNIDKVYLYKGDVRMTDGRSVNSTTRKATFSGLNLMLAAGESAYLSVRADIANPCACGGDTARFSINAAADVTGTANLSGAFPITGNSMTFSATVAGTISVSSNGTIATPTIGQNGAIIGKFSLDASGEDATLRQIALKVDNAQDHANYKLWKGTSLLGVGLIGKDLVTFVLTNPLVIQDGNTANLQVSADVGGQAADKIKVSVQEKGDVVATGGDFGFNMAVDITGYDATGSACSGSGLDCSFSTIQGGKLTFAFNGPASDDIQIDGKDQVLMNFSITAQQLTDLKQFNVLLTCVSPGGNCDEDADAGGLVNGVDSKANLQDVTIRKTDGSAWMGPEEYSATNANDDAATLTFSDDQTLTAGQTVDLMITSDIYNGAVDGDVVKASLDMSTVDAEDTNGDSLATTDIVPTADITGNQFTLRAAKVTVTVSKPPSDSTFVAGTANVPVVGYAFKAGNSSDITVTDLTITSTGDTDGTFTGGVSENDIAAVGDHVSSCSLYNDQTNALVDGPESPDTNNKLVFTSFTWTVAAGNTGKLVLKCNLSNNTPDGGNPDAYAFFISGASNVTSQDKDGNNVVETFTPNVDPSITVDGAGPSDNLANLPKITVTDTGSLAITLDGSTPKSTLILGASTGVQVAKYKFTATNEAFLVTDVTLDNTGSDTIASAVKLTYQDKAGATQTATGFLSGGSVTFSGLTMYVPTTSTRVLTASVDTNTVSSTGATSGDSLLLSLNADTETFKAVGDGSGDTVTEDDLGYTVDANGMTIRKTKPTISLASGSPSGAGVPGLAEVLRFNVSADSRGFVTLNQILFKVSASDNNSSAWDTGAGTWDTAAKWEFYDAADPSTKLDDDLDWSFLNSSGGALGGGDKLTFAVLTLDGHATPAEEIGAGETKTYVLKTDDSLVGPGGESASASGDDSIRIDIPDQTEATAVGLDSIHWEDDVEDTSNIDGSYIKNLPVNGGTILY